MSESLPSAEILARPVDPETAIAYWAWKAAMTDAEARKLDDGARMRAFYVTGLSQRDAVQTVKDALAEALKNGESVADFQKRIADVIASAGWLKYRVETIFRNNLQTAYAVGRYVQMQEVKQARPYWQYYGIDDDNTRPHHAVLHGAVYPADHEIWHYNYPPNGHRCRCGVRSLSARQVKKQGLTVREKMPGPCKWMNPRSGLVYDIDRPGGDPGFRSNPGKDWLSGLDLKKHPDLTPESYDEQRLRPLPVSTLSELADGIKERCSRFARNSDGIHTITFDDKSYFMATTCKGALFISKREFNTRKGAFEPSFHLKRAWNRLAHGEKLEWREEYALESLWHELVHNRQHVTRTGRNTVCNRVMEMVTQWTARRTYPDFIRSLGGKAAHLDSIKKDGLGYGGWIRNLDRLLGAIKADEKRLLPEMLKIIDTKPMDGYLTALADFLSKETGATKSALRTALGRTNYPDAAYEELLGNLKLVK